MAEAIPGPSTQSLGKAAAKNNAYVVAGIYERDGKAVYNTSVLIGRDGKLPWHISEDLKRFKRLTLGSAMVMGRRTFDMGDPDEYVGQYEFQVPIFVVTHRPWGGMRGPNT